MAHASTGGAAGELSQALQIISMWRRHLKARWHEERTPEEVMARTDGLHTEGTAAAGRRDTRGQHGWEEVIRETEKRATAAEDALFAEAVAFERVIAAGECGAYDVEAALLNLERPGKLTTKTIIVELQDARVTFSDEHTRNKRIMRARVSNRAVAVIGRDACHNVLNSERQHGFVVLEEQRDNVAIAERNAST